MRHYELDNPGIPSSGEKIEVHSPFDESPLATVECYGPEGLEKALRTADKLSSNRDTWLPVPQRIAILEKAGALMASRAEDLALTAAREGGKPLIDSRIEVARAVDGFKICVETLRTDAGRVIPMNVNPASAGRTARTRHEPIGTVAAISAFNHPVNLIVHQVAPAVATGCPVLVKPASATPLSCLNVVQILREAGLPPEWCQPVLFKDTALAGKMAGDSRVAFLSFIGSAKVGWSLRSQLAPGTRCALEHGGAAPVVVAADADTAAALPLLVKGGFYHAGQVCVSVQRVYVEAAMAKEFAQQLAAAARRLKVGDPASPETEVGPLIRASEVDRVEAWVQEAVKAGAQCLAGGQRISRTCYEPTVLFNPPDTAKVSCEEVFGPVVCVYSYQGLDEAITRANSVPFSFQAAVFTRSQDTMLRATDRLNGSAILVNDHTAFRVDWMPFAGLKESGLGVGGIPYTMHDMQIEKMVIIKSSEIK